MDDTSTGAPDHEGHDAGERQRGARFLPDQLGTLGPRAHFLAGAIFWVLVMLALGFQFAEAQRWRDKLANLDPLYAGYGLVLLDEGIIFGVAPATKAARNAGIRRGDSIIAVNGEDYGIYTDGLPTDTMTASEVARLIRDAGSNPITLTVQSLNESQQQTADLLAGRDMEDKDYWRHVDLERSAAAKAAALGSLELKRRWALKAIEWAIAALLIASAIILWWKKRRELVNILAAGAIAIMAGRVGTWVVSTDFDEAAITTFNIVQNLGIALFILTLPALPDGRYRPVAARWIMLGGAYVFLSSVVLAALNRLPLMLFTVPPPGLSVAWNAVYTLENYARPALLLVAIGLAILKFRRTPKGPERQQAKFIGLGLVAGFVAVAAGYGWEFFSTWLGFSGLVSIIIGDLAAILKHLGPLLIVLGVIASQLRFRLNDADAFISRTAAYGVVTAAITTLWGSLTTWTTAALAAIGGSASASGISTILAAVVFVPARKRVLDWTEMKFQPALVRMRSLPAKISALAHDHDPAEIGHAALRATVHGVGASHGAIALAEEDRYVVIAAQDIGATEVADYLARDGEQSKPGLPFPVRIELSDLLGPVGLLLLGPRSDGAGYSSDEKDALKLIRGPLGEVLRATARRASRNASMASLLAQLEGRISAMEVERGS